MNLVASLLNNETAINDFTKNLLKTVIIAEIKNMLYYIHYKYPNYFSRKDANTYIKKYSHIIFEGYSETKKGRISRNIKKKLLKRRFKNSKTLASINNKNKIISNYSETDKYCNARVWNGGSITVIDDKTTIYGGRCSRPHIKGKEYCHQHIIKNKHQNYFKNPSPELIQHFKKYSLNNNK
jgi:hypothetical protein